MAQWLSWLERRPVTAEVESSSLFWVVIFLKKKIIKYNGILAQLGEHLPYKQRVIGSSPIGPIFGRFPEWPKGTDCKSAANCFGGSNPPPSTLADKIRLQSEYADVAQLAEQLICNQQVIGSSPIIGLHFYNAIWMVSRVAKGDRL